MAVAPLPITASKVADQWTSLLVTLRNARSAVLVLQSEIGASSVNSGDALGALSQLVSVVSQIQFIQSETSLLPSFVSYVQEQLGQPTFDVSGAASAILSATQALGTAIATDYPKDANGFLADRKFDASGNVVASTFTAAQFPTTPAAITTFLAALA